MLATTLLRAEALHLLRRPAHAAVLAALFAILAWSAWSSGQVTADLRAQAKTEEAAWAARWTDASLALSRAGQDPRKSALAAFNMARHAAPPSRLAPEGVPWLAAGQYQRLSTGLRASIDGRHLESRRGDEISSPVGQGQGTPDYVVLVALLLPLATIALGYGRVQEARTSGLWSLVRVQAGRPWPAFALGLVLQWFVLMVVVSVATLAGVAADTQTQLLPLLGWLLAGAAYSGFWVALTGLANLPKVSAAASAVVLLAFWALLCLLVPATVDRVATRERPASSRVETLIRLREIQQEAESRSDELMQHWYAQHPQQRRDDLQPHAWPVSWVPRYLWQDAQMRPLMLRFEEARARRYLEVEKWGSLSPASALVVSAEQLAGIDALRYAQYVRQINRYEDAWRAHFVPRIMSYASLLPAEIRQTPRPSIEAPRSSAMSAIVGLWVACGAAWGLLALLRHRLD